MRGRRLWVILIRTWISRISNFSFPLCSPTLKNQTENPRRRWYHVGKGSCIWHLYSSVWQCTQWQVWHHDLPLQGSCHLRAGVPAPQYLCHAMRPLGPDYWEPFDSWFLPWLIMHGTKMRWPDHSHPAPFQLITPKKRKLFWETNLEEVNPCSPRLFIVGLHSFMVHWSMHVFLLSRPVTHSVF